MMQTPLWLAQGSASTLARVRRARKAFDARARRERVLLKGLDLD